MSIMYLGAAETKTYVLTPVLARFSADGRYDWMRKIRIVVFLEFGNWNKKYNMI